MYRAQTLIALLALAPLTASDFSGQQALEYTKAVVAFGPRPAGTPALAKTRAYIIGVLKSHGWQVSEDAFAAKTPAGTLQMSNIIARKPGSSGKAVAITGHYDTKRFNFPFVGANDAGSSSGTLLELARTLKKQTLKNDVYLVFFDGEEAVKEWSTTDGVYGSRHLADRWQKEGVNSRLKALINVDMIGDRDLHIVRELYSSDSLRRLIWQIAAQLGHSGNFNGGEGAIEDDHVPFLRKGVSAVDLIDFENGPNHSWWHTPQDTMDKLSANSLQVVGDVLVETVKRLD